jgi:membrane associated rhomboid family serine protease
MDGFFNAIITLVEQSKAHMGFLFAMLGIVWGVFAITLLSGRTLLLLGIYPRSLFGLIGIPLSPFLHANFNHIFFNSIPLFLLSDFLLIAGINLYLNISLYLILMSGVFTWLFARPAIHVGASAVITGYWSFLVVNVLSHGGAMSILLGLISMYYFAGIFFGIFPAKKGVSWEGHLSGFVSGLIINFTLGYLPMIHFVS